MLHYRLDAETAQRERNALFGQNRKHHHVTLFSRVHQMLVEVKEILVGVIYRYESLKLLVLVEFS